MMNREIKFRAWDKKQNKFLEKNKFILCPTNPWSAFINRKTPELEKIYNNYLRKNGDILGSGGIWIAEGADFYGENLELMQYTGLKDKNGVEIYEGDILQYYFLESKSKSTQKFFVEWDSLNLCYKGIIQSPIYKFEVIGNIYENPELCK